MTTPRCPLSAFVLLYFCFTLIHYQNSKLPRFSGILVVKKYSSLIKYWKSGKKLIFFIGKAAKKANFVLEKRQMSFLITINMLINRTLWLFIDIYQIL